MKRVGYFLAAACMALALGACGTPNKDSGAVDATDETTTASESVEITKQSASAYLDQDGTTVTATVDLTGGWSVEFVRGAFYLYDGEFDKDTPAVAIGMTLDQEVYQQDLDEALAAADHEEADGGIYYSRETDECFLCSLDDSAYFLLTTESGNIKEIRSRITLELDQ